MHELGKDFRDEYEWMYEFIQKTDKFYFYKVTSDMGIVSWLVVKNTGNEYFGNMSDEYGDTAFTIVEENYIETFIKQKFDEDMKYYEGKLIDMNEYDKIREIEQGIV